jgi:hypothetical protein
LELLTPAMTIKYMDCFSPEHLSELIDRFESIEVQS